MDIVIGTDPEVFVRNLKTGKLVSAHGMVHGTKAQPFPVKAGAVQVDGMALEININPAKNAVEFSENIKTVMNELNNLIGKDMYELVSTPTAFFDDDVWYSTPEEAKELGCDADYNAWNGNNANPKPHTDLHMRTGAGHIHVGWCDGVKVASNSHQADCSAIVRQLDCSIGLESLILDSDNQRRQLYGQAGAFRPKPYGVEYRTLSNYWLASEESMKSIFDKTKEAVEMLAQGVNFNHFLGDSVEHVINTNDTKTAKSMLVDLRNEFNLKWGQYYV